MRLTPNVNLHKFHTLRAARRGVLEIPDGDHWRTPLQKKGTLPAIVALGKFDALHIGHRSLASTAAAMGGHPWLISFSGMAQVMGWDTSRLPLVPQVELPYVLGGWTDACLGRTPSMRYLPFARVRQESPEDFFGLLVNELGAQGVVAGANYRFGYKAAGDVRTLKELGLKHNVKVEIVELVGLSNSDLNNGQVSSSKVREALEHGALHLVKEFLQRDYTLLVESQRGVQRSDGILFPKDSYLNQPPGDGTYKAWVHSDFMELELSNDGVLCPSSVALDLSSNVVKFTFVC